MKLLTAKVQVPYVPVQFNARTESSPLAAIDPEPPHRHGSLDRTEECWQLLANNDCEPLDDSEIEKMLMLIEEKLEILLEVESYETNNHLQANLNEEIEELGWQQNALRKEVNRRDAMDILDCRKRTSSRGAPIQGAGTGSSVRINRGFSQPEMISNGNAVVQSEHRIRFRERRSWKRIPIPFSKRHLRRSLYPGSTHPNDR